MAAGDGSDTTDLEDDTGSPDCLAIGPLRPWQRAFWAIWIALVVVGAVVLLAAVAPLVREPMCGCGG